MVCVLLVFLVLAMSISFVFRKLKFMNWKLYVFTAGPIAWFGLMECSLHPALALCFVVPFLPNELPAKRDRINHTARNEDNEDGHHHDAKAPLHAFEHDLKPFVDIGVMFTFGLVNGGVQMKYVGPLSVTIFLSLGCCHFLHF